MGYLSLAIFLPIVAGGALLLLGRAEQARLVRWLALGASLVSFVVTLPLVCGFKLGHERFNLRIAVILDLDQAWRQQDIAHLNLKLIARLF